MHIACDIQVDDRFEFSQRCWLSLDLCSVMYIPRKKKIFEEVKTITQRITTIDSILHTSEISNLCFLKFIREKIKYSMKKMSNLTAFH